MARPRKLHGSSGLVLCGLLIGLALGSTAQAAPHPKLAEAIDRLNDAQANIGSSDPAKWSAQLSKAIDLIQAEPAGPEWQGHRQSAVALLQSTVEKIGQGQSPSDFSNDVTYAVAEINAAITDADNYVPPATTAPANSLDISEDPDLLKIRYEAEGSAPPYPVGARYESSILMKTDNPNDVLHGKPVYFKMNSEKSIHFIVDSGKPLTKMFYTGRPYRTLTIEIKDAQGHPITGVGPFSEGNVEKMLEIPLPNLTEFEIVVTNYAAAWSLIQDIHFEPSPKSPPATP